MEHFASCVPHHTRLKKWNFILLIIVSILASHCKGDLEQFLSVREEQSASVYVGTIGEGNSNIAPPFQAFEDSPDFNIDLVNGDIRTSKKLDRETTANYQLVFFATTTGNIIKVYINVTDDNDHSPYFPNGSKSLSLSETTPVGTKVIVGSVVDQDIGQNGIQDAQIIVGNEDGHFELRTKRSGSSLFNLELETKSALDYEEKSTYNLLIRVVDGGDPQRSGDVRVNVTIIDANDNPPQFIHTKYSIRVNESVPVGTSIARVEATDQDSGENAKITYTLDHLYNSEERFSVDPSSGIVRVNKPLDYETTQKYELSVIATDNGSQPLFSSARIEVFVENINEKPATINLMFLTTSNQSAAVAENATIGTYVVRISVSDPDNPTEYFSNINVSLQGDLGHFGLRTEDKVIYFIYVKSLLDRENVAKYDLNIVAVDSGDRPLHATSSFTLFVDDINDNAPSFSKKEYQAEISEQSAVGTPVTKVTATDKDEGQNAKITYRILDVQDTNSDWFKIDSNTGFISTRVDKTDCEVNAQPRITVVASDSGIPSLSSTTVVLVTIRDVNDMEPEFHQSFYKTSVKENAEQGKCFLQVSAFDPDCNGNAQVTYHLANMTQSSLNVFGIVSTTGCLYAAKPLDYETQKIYEFPVYATDSGGLDSSVIVSINIEDVNDNRPQFYPQNYSTNINVNIQPGDNVITVQAIDLDSGNYSTILYSMLGGNDDNLFSIDRHSGKITLINVLPQEEKVYILQIGATDGGDLSSSQSATVYISVTGANSHPPVFNQPTYRFTVEENVAKGTSVGRVLATVPSVSNNPDILYTITTGDINNFFSINQQTGEITTKVSRLHYHLYPYILLGVKAETGKPPVYGSAQVNISISDVNDHAPEFLSSYIEITVFEDQDLSTTIYMAHATDKDSGSNGTVQYRLAVNPANTFAVDAASGEVRLNKALDYESQQEYSLIVSAFDLGTPSLSSNLTLKVKVSNINDNSPIFTQKSYEQNVKETAAMDTVVLNVTATDADNDQVTYTLLNEDSGMFGIHGGSGQSGNIYLRAELDRETRDSYAFTVLARDNGKNPRSAQVPVRITVIDANDNNPVFSLSSYMFYIEENNHAITVIGSVVATDKDIGDNAKLTYTIIDQQTDFSINPYNGEISTTKSLDREQLSKQNYEHKFSVQVSDAGIPPRSHIAHVTVRVLDINDNNPVIENPSLDQYVDENKIKGTPVIKIQATDPDNAENGTITFLFDPSSDPESLRNFDIHPITGLVTTAEVLDYEAKNLYTVRVIARDNGMPFKQTVQTITIHVRDANDGTPTFPSRNITFEVLENTAVGSVVAAVQAFDKDSGENGRISYYIVEGNVFGLFSVNVSTGDIYCIREIDYEESSSHYVGIKAVDNGAYNPKSSTIGVYIKVIDLNDSPPEFDSDPVVLKKKENMPVGQVVYTFTASDRDSGNNGTVFYSLKQQNPKSDLLELDGSTGALKVKSEINYEEVKMISLVIEAHDLCSSLSCRKHTALSMWIVIEDENDNNPVFKSYTPFDIKENEAIGYRIVYIVASDADSGINGQVEYSIDGGNDDGRFEINSHSGLLSIRSPLDREVKSNYNLNIMARDNGLTPRSSFTSLTINIIDVNDNKPRFQMSKYQGKITENNKGGDFIVAVSATDNDGDSNNNRLTYSLPNGIANNRFSLDPNSGHLTATGPLDREQQSSYVITVYVTDHGNPSLYDTATVNITIEDQNDNPPVFTESKVSINIPENAGRQIIQQILAVDLDTGDNSKLIYTIEGAGNIGSAFEINSETGELSCNSLDREVVSTYNLTIVARDQGQPSQSTTCNVLVHVLDDNDNAPKFSKDSYNHNILENIAVGSTVLLVSAMDDDEGDNAKVTYSLGNDTEGQFQINSKTGEIITSRLFDHERKSTYTFNVVAKDGGGNMFSSTATVTIGIQDINDNSPVFTEVPFTKSLNPSPSINTYVTEVTAHDADSGNIGLVTYSLGPNTPYFKIDSQTGVVRTNSALPSDKKMFNIEVIASDGGSPAKSSTGFVLVTVGTSSSGLRFKQKVYTTSLKEHAPKDSDVQTVEAEHYGGNIAGTITYSIVSGNEKNTFSINQGRIQVNDYLTLDYETQRRVKVVVAATDGQLYDYTTVWVELTDINDNRPLFAQNHYYATVQEHSSNGAYVTQVLATDLDDGRNANITYNIVTGNNGGAFIIEPIYSGIVKVKHQIDLEITPWYQLTIEAKDGGSPAMSSQCQLTVNITDINDQQPNFPVPTPVDVLEGTQVGSQVAVITANDVDNPVLRYSFTPQGNHDNMFTMEKFSGKIILAKRLDHESKKHYVLGLQVTDGPHQAKTTLNVNVIDENDNSPAFTQNSYHANLPELSAVGTTVDVVVNATDADSGKNSQITYSIVNDETSSFSIQPDTGIIKTTQEIVYNPSSQIITLTIKAQDAGTTPRSSMVAVKVNITQVNQSPPSFELSSYKADVSEAQKVGHSVIQVRVTSTSQDVDYSITGGHENKFRINQKTGIISINGHLDREMKDKYLIKVSAIVRGSPLQTVSTDVEISVSDVNDKTPEFTQTEYDITLPENYNSGQIFMSVLAKDNDTGVNAELSYSITSGNDNGLFSINSVNGNMNIALGSNLDYETEKSHKIIITAVDCKQCANNVRQLSAYTSVNINITDINDNNPFFPQPFYFLSVLENRNNTLVGEVHANDKDHGPFGVLTYQIDSNKGHNQFFYINSNDGKIYTRRLFDYENLPSLAPGLHSYDLTVIATDSGGLYASTPVVILIDDEDEHVPTFTKDKFEFSVPGNAKAGDLIGQVKAQDLDGGLAGRIYYSLSETNSHLKYFGIYSTNGSIYVKHEFSSSRRKRSAELSRAKRFLDESKVTLVVTASSGPTNKATAVVEIQVNRTCPGCEPPRTAPQEGVSTTIIVIVVLVIIVIISIVVLIIFIIRYKNKKGQPPVAEVYDGDFNGAFDFPTPSNKARETYQYDENLITTPDVSEQSHHSASSGRGSVEADEDDEVMRINSQSVLNSSSGYRSKNMPDSGLPDDDNLSEPSVQNSKDYLAKLGIDTTIQPKKSKQTIQPSEPFSDIGSGDNESINISDIDYSKFGPVNDTSYSDGGKDLGFHEIEPQHEGTISNVINSEEEYSGSYNWDYLLNWGPQYQPLAHVFVEIAKLKDDTIQPKKQPVQTVPQRNISTSLNPQVKMVPPPIITNAPPTAVPQPIRSSHGAGKSNRTSNNMTTSFQNMPRSPIQHESSFTSPALTPSFTPSLSPLATRSPEPSYNQQNMVHSHQSGNHSVHSHPSGNHSVHPHQSGAHSVHSHPSGNHGVHSHPSNSHGVHPHQNGGPSIHSRGRHHSNNQVILSHDPEQELRI